MLILLLFTVINTQAQDTTEWMRSYYQSSDPFQKATISQRLGNYYYQHENYQAGIYWAQTGLPYALKTKTDTVIWNHYDLLANLHDNAIHFDTSINYMMLSLAVKQKAKNLRKMAGTYNDLGVVYGEKTELVKQADYYYKAKKIYDQIGDTVEGTLVAVNLASNLHRQRKFQQAIEAYRNLMPKLRHRDFWGLLYQACGRMAICFGELGEKDSSFYYSMQEINTTHALQDTLWAAEAWGRRAYLCGWLDNKKDFKEALDSTEYYGKLSGEYFNWGDYYLALGHYYRKVTKQYSEAIRNYKKSLDFSNQYSDKSSRLGLMINVAQTYAEAGKNDSAYQTMVQAYALKDSIITDDGRVQLAEMETKYETEKKEAQIELLDKDNKLKQRTSYFLIGGLSLFAILLATLFHNNRQKQKTNRKLQTLNTALDEANKSKVQLFSILSHDLRSPVSNLYSYLQLKKIAPQMLSEEKRQQKEEQLQTSAGHLLETMEDVLIWSKSHLENFEPEKVEVSLCKMVEHVVNIYKPVIESKHLQLLLPDEDLHFVTDEHMLQTILRNILSNAVKHTPEKGCIEICFGKAPLKITVFNSGKPIEASVAKSLFTWGNIRSGSHGYGLKISKALTDKLGLKLSLETMKEGNKFVVSI